MNDVTIYTDGGSRGNPGPAAYGFVIRDSHNQLLVQVGKEIGVNTNNVAEYMAVVSALTWLRDQNYTPTYIYLFLDSELIARQLLGQYKIKHPTLKPLYYRIHELLDQLHTKITVKHIPREQNKDADRMVNLALDGKI